MHAYDIGGPRTRARAAVALRDARHLMVAATIWVRSGGGFVPAAMPGSDPQGIAWVCADARLGREAAKAAAAQMVASITGLVPQDVLAAWNQAQGTPWTIQTPYYESVVAHYFAEKADLLPSTPAVVLLVHRDSPLQEHEQRVQAQEGFDVPIALVVGMGNDTASGAPQGDIDETYAVHGWEYVEARDEDALTRVREALMVHQWPNAVPAESEAIPPGVRALAQLPDAERPWPAAPAAMQKDLDAFLEADDEFGTFVSAEGPADSDIDSLYPHQLHSLQNLIDHVKSLPPGPARRDAAAHVAMEVERALASSKKPGSFSFFFFFCLFYYTHKPGTWSTSIRSSVLPT